VQYTKKETGLQLHLPFHKYAGPGTHLMSNLIFRVKPINSLDQASLIHDIDYLNPYISKWKADNNMASNLAKRNVALSATVRLALASGSYLVPRKTDYKEYVEAKKLAYMNGFVPYDMHFTP